MHGQDTINLPVFTVERQGAPQPVERQGITLDSLAMRTSANLPLSDALANHTPMFIKNYGTGALATPAFRGTSASHTQVLWNGVNINTATLGQMDFSLIPAGFADRITLIHGENSLHKGSGGLGGTVLLENLPNWKDSLMINARQSLSSLMATQTLVENNLIVSNLLLNTRAFYVHSANHYTYKNNAMAGPPYPEEKQTNAGYKQLGFMENIRLRLNHNNLITAHVWAQQSHREIPGAITVKDRDEPETQDNLFVRTLISWKNKRENTQWMIRGGYLYDIYQYHNPIPSLSLENTHGQYTFKANVSHRFSRRFTMMAGLDYDRHRVVSDNYQGSFRRNLSGAYTTASLQPHKRLSSRLLLRAEKNGNSKPRLLPGISISYVIPPFNQLLFHGSLARNHRMPSMNDMYWFPGGNPELKPEMGMSYTAGLEYAASCPKNQMHMNLSGSWFLNNVSNWILWQPDSIASYWTPHNLREVKSQGVESKIKASIPWGNNIITVNLRHTYTRSESTKPLYPGDQSRGKQLIYTPEHTASAMVFLHNGPWHGTTAMQYTGKRYTTSDNSRYLPPFTLFNMEAGRKWIIKNHPLNTSIRVNNIFNTSYQSVAWYPMPGRSITFNIRYQWKKQ